jgi:hypothetical protein
MRKTMPLLLLHKRLLVRLQPRLRLRWKRPKLPPLPPKLPPPLPKLPPLLPKPPLRNQVGAHPMLRRRLRRLPRLQQMLSRQPELLWTLPLPLPIEFQLLDYRHRWLNEFRFKQ